MADLVQPQWYVVHTYSGYENKVKANLEKTIENNGLEDMIQEISIPIEEALEIKNNRRKRILPPSGKRRKLCGSILNRGTKSAFWPVLSRIGTAA